MLDSLAQIKKKNTVNTSASSPAEATKSAAAPQCFWFGADAMSALPEHIQTFLLQMSFFFY